MRRSAPFIVSALLLSAAPGALLAQEEKSGGPPIFDEGEDVVVTGAPERGAVIGNVKPEQQLGPADVRALGVSSISELLSELAPQTNAASGAPVVLLNGKRISSFSEIQDLPTEAVQRVDILPEEVALSYGYTANQKVVNIVLRPRFRAETGEVRGGLSTDGGRENGLVDGALLRIRGDNRVTLDLKYSRTGNILESDRDIIPAAPSRPYALGGNVTALTRGGDIADLSALAGQPVAIASVPASAAAGAPSLADFLAGANVQEISDLGRYRTLSPSTESFSANATLARALGSVSATINGRLELSESNSLQGLTSLALQLAADNPFSPFSQDVSLYRYLDGAAALGQRVRGTTGHIGVSLEGRIAEGWLWSFTGNADYSDTRTVTDRGFDNGDVQSALNAGNPAVNPFGPISPDLLTTTLTDSARAKSQAVTGDLLVSGSLFSLPAGAVTTSIRIGGTANGYDQRSLRSSVAGSSSYNREIGSGQISLDLPITSRSKGVLGAVGDLSVNLNAAAQRLSDFGTLSTLGYGLRWTPIRQVRLLVSASQDRAAPTGQQLNDPLISTPNVSVFDYATGETVFVTRLSGGNGNLRESVRDQFRLGPTLKPWDKTNFTFTMNYLNSRTNNPIAAFPTPTPAIEAAFSQRFVRDEDGTLLSIDSRPINFASSHSSRLRWGFDYSITLKSSLQKKVEAWRAAGAKPEDRPPELRELFGNRPRPPGFNNQGNTTGQSGSGGQGGTGSPGSGAQGPRSGGGFGGGGFGGGGRGGGGGAGGGRLSFGFYHTWHIAESILIAPGVPRLDLLDGDATGSSGGQPRHELSARIGYNNNGLGARLGVDWESGTHVDGALGGASRLDFGSLATANLRLFANLAQMPSLVKDHPFLRGARVTFSIDNVFNTRRDVTDATGATPLRYQPGYLDPQGRTITLSFRKLFF